MCFTSCVVKIILIEVFNLWACHFEIKMYILSLLWTVVHSMYNSKSVPSMCEFLACVILTGNF